MMKSVVAACAGFCLATQAHQAAALIPNSDGAARPRSAPMMGGAYLGMTFAAWKALTRPPSLSARAVPSCSGGSASGDLVGRPAVDGEPGRPVVCSYLARYGAVTLTQSLQLTPKYLARDPHYTFVDGRLTMVAFLTSVDAFDALMAKFIQAYGAPAETVRDTTTFGGAMRFPRVQKLWRLGDQQLRITDPAKRPGRLEVELSLVRQTSAAAS